MSVLPFVRFSMLTLPSLPRSIDDKVPIQQSKDVVAALKAKGGVPHEFEVREGEDHLFDMSAEVELPRMYAFIKRYL